MKPMLIATDEALYTKLITAARPTIKTWVSTVSAKYQNKELTEAVAINEARQAASILGNMNDNDIEALAFLILMQAAKSAQEDLKAVMASVKAINAEKAKQREKINNLNKEKSTTAVKPDQQNVQIKKDSPLKVTVSPETAKKLNIQKDELGELTQEQQLRLQMYMDRLSQMEQAISNILKKIADTQNQIIQNIK